MHSCLDADIDHKSCSCYHGKQEDKMHNNPASIDNKLFLSDPSAALEDRVPFINST